MDEPVYALTVDSAGNLVAGGDFTSAGGESANHIAHWDGSSWSAFGSGLAKGVFRTSVFSLAADGTGNIFVGGGFGAAGGVNVRHIARWDGINWRVLIQGNGMDDAVAALTVDGSGNLYAGGSFATAGSVYANRIAKWNGTTWSALGIGLDGLVKALTVDGSGNLYAGGAFSTAGGLSANNIAKWDGTSWSALGAGMDGKVTALAVD